MRNSSNLLINEPPLMILPSLAVTIGLNEAVILQQIHYWLITPKIGLIHDDRKWIFNTYEEWQETNFPFWSVSTIKRAILDLECSGLLETAYLSEDKGDRTKYYTINYDRLAMVQETGRTPDMGVQEIPSGQFDPMDEFNLTPCNGSKRDDGSGQIDPLLNRLTETTQETTTETTPASPEISEPKPHHTDAVKKGDLMDGILAFAHAADPLADYPPDVQDVLKEFIRLWPADVPIKARKGKSGEFDFWCNGSRQLAASCGEYGLSILDQVFLDWQKRPFTVSHPAALIRVTAGKVIELRSKKKASIQQGPPLSNPARVERLRQLHEQDRLNKSVSP